MQYLVVIEKNSSGSVASVPEQPGLIAAGETRDQAIRLIHEAMEFHIKGLVENGQPVTLPSSQAELVEVAASLKIQSQVLKL